MPDLSPRDQLVLDLVGRGQSGDDLHYYLAEGHRRGLAAYFDPGLPGDVEELLRGMERRGLVERDGFEWRRVAKVERSLF